MINKTLALSLSGLILIHSTSHADEPSPKRVTTASLSSQLILNERSSPASVISLEQGQISAQLSALITKVHGKVGDKVEKGETLVSLDCRDFQLNKDSSKAALNEAQKELARAKTLSRKQSIAEQGLNRAETGVIQARSQYNASQLQIERCTIKAPYNAIITQRQVSQGMLANPGMPLLTLVNPEQIEASAKLSPRLIESLSNAPEISYRSSGEHYPLTLRTIIPIIDDVSKTQEARLSFQESKAHPGDNGRIHWSIPGNYVPSSLVQERGGRLGVFSNDSGTALFTPLPSAKPGKPTLTDLPVDTRLVIQGRFSINDGDTLDVTEATQ